MFQAHREVLTQDHPRRREFPRFDIHCRARIRIADRQYAGYLHNISQGGAKLRTITPIRKVGNIILRLPDLPPLRCQLRWTDSYNAGVLFASALDEAELSRWAEARVALIDQSAEIGVGDARPERRRSGWART